jgi:hypothetical protein
MRTKGKRTVTRWIGSLALLLFLTSLVYLTLFSMFTYVTPYTNERFAKGFVCNPQTERLYPGQCPFVDAHVLADAQYNAEEIWTGWSVELMQVVIVSLWLAAFVFLSSLIGTFLVFQTKTASAKPKTGEHVRRTQSIPAGYTMSPLTYDLKLAAVPPGGFPRVVAQIEAASPFPGIRAGRIGRALGDRAGIHVVIADPPGLLAE